MNEAAAKIVALNELGASLIRSGAPADAVQKFIAPNLIALSSCRGNDERVSQMADSFPQSESRFLRWRISPGGRHASISWRK